MRRAALALHVGLMVASATTIVAFAQPLPLRTLLAAIGLLPLALTLPGLSAVRAGTLRWLALALVLYAGFGCVETIATGMLAAALVLLFALVELALVLTMIRRTGNRSRDAAAAR